MTARGKSLERFPVLSARLYLQPVRAPSTQLMMLRATRIAHPALT